MSKQVVALKDGRVVLQSDYVTAKTGDLRNFGYSDLTEDTVQEQVQKIVSNNGDLNVIGMLCSGDIDVSRTQKENSDA